MSQEYFDPERADDPYALPDCEIWFVSEQEANELNANNGCDCPQEDECSCEAINFERGWYWHACFPGCLPDSEPSGPFTTYKEALADARSLDDD